MFADSPLLTRSPLLAHDPAHPHVGVRTPGHPRSGVRTHTPAHARSSAPAHHRAPATGRRWLVVGGWGLLTALVGAVTRSALAALQEPGPPRAEDAVAALAGGAGLLVAGWLGLATLLTVAAELRPRTRWGALAGVAAPRIAPAVLRRAVVLALGLGLLGTSPAVAAAPHGPGAASLQASTTAAAPSDPDPTWGADGSEFLDPGWVPATAWQEPAPLTLPIPVGSATQDAFRRFATVPAAPQRPAEPVPASPSSRPTTSPSSPDRAATTADPITQRTGTAATSGPHPDGPGTASTAGTTGAPTGTRGSGTAAATTGALAAGTAEADTTGADMSAGAGTAIAAGTVLVRPGDCLWEIAARRLGPSAGTARIAAGWHRWYAANRAVIGPDPDLLQPGLRLRAPDGGGAAGGLR